MTAGSELRLTPVPFAEWDAEARSTLLAHLRRPELYLSGAADAPPMPSVLELFALHLPVGDAFMRFTGTLAGPDARLDAATRELLILRVAWRTRSGYEWAQHARLGVDAGLTAEQVAAVPQGTRAQLWSPAERSLLAAADEMVDCFAVSEGTWAELATTFDAAQLLELLFVVAGYLCLSAVLNSVGLQGPLPSEPPERDEGGVAS